MLSAPVPCAVTVTVVACDAFTDTPMDDQKAEPVNVRPVDAVNTSELGVVAASEFSALAVPVDVSPAVPRYE